MAHSNRFRRSSLFSMWLTLSVVILIWIPATTVVVESAQCSSKKHQYQCPNPEACPENGYSLVSDCLTCEGSLSTEFELQECFDRKLLSPNGNPSKSYFYRDLVGMIVWFFAAGVAISCGVGGGGIYVPLGILLLGFAPKQSSGLSQASIFGATLGGLILNIRDRHPFTYKVVSTTDSKDDATTVLTRTGSETISSIPTTNDVPESSETCRYYSRPLIDYDMVLFLAPVEMTGALIGVLVQSVLPNWLYLMTASLILAITAKKTYDKWWDTRTKEKMAAEKCSTTTTAVSEEVITEPQPTLENGEDPSTSKYDGESPPIPELPLEDNSDSDQMDTKNIARRDFLLQRDDRQYPTEKLLVFVVLWVGLTLLTFLRGGKGVESLLGITCESPWYAVLIAISILWTMGFAVYFGWKLVKDTNEKQSVGYPFHPQDVLWDFRNTLLYSFFTFAAGVIAGLIGIGGGMILGPLMLYIGIHPRVSTASTATMIALTSSSVAILFITSGQVPWQYALCFFCTTFVGAYVGKTYIDGYVKKTGKASILIFLLATIIAFATIGTLYTLFSRLADADWCFAGFQEFCKASSASQQVTCASDDVRMLQQSFFANVVSMYQH